MKLMGLLYQSDIEKLMIFLNCFIKNIFTFGKDNFYLVCKFPVDFILQRI